MSLSSRSKRVENELTEDKAKRDASYEYSKGSKEPIAEGAFKGALASGLSSRFVGSRAGWKGQAANLAAGVIGGGVAGKIYNNKKVEDAKKAKKWLAHKTPKSEYGKKIKDIYKKASRINDVGSAVTNSSQEIRNNVPAYILEQQNQKKESLSSAAKTGAIAGAGLGALTRLKSGGIGGAIGGAVLGTLGSSAENRIHARDGKDDSALRTVGTTAAGMATGAMLEPTVNRGLGYAAERSKSWNPTGRVGKFIKKDMARYDKSEMQGLADANRKVAGRNTFMSKYKNYIPFASGGNSNQLDYVDGKNIAKKGGSGFFKGIGKAIARKGIKWGLAGAVLGYGTHKLTGYTDKQMEKRAGLNISLNDAVGLKNYTSEKDSNIDLTSSAIKNTTKAALLFGAGSYLTSNHTARKAIAGVGGAFFANSFLNDVIKKNKGKDFIESSGSKKREIVTTEFQKKEDSNKFHDEVGKSIALFGGIHVAKMIGLGENTKKKNRPKRYSLSKDL